MLGKLFQKKIKTEDPEQRMISLASLIGTPHWEQAEKELTMMLVRLYEEYDKAESYEDFIKIQSKIEALRKFFRLKDLTRNYISNNTPKG